MTDPAARVFRKEVRAYAKKYGRSLPWRQTRDPYRILVSEVMLQQTQVDRVIPKYKSFLKEFPTVRSLARSSLGDVLKEWSGLGYNRRAKMLHLCARGVAEKWDGKLPKTEEALRALPGIGPYTARAILAFAHNIAAPLIETNVRTVYLYHFFPGKEAVADKELLLLIERTMDRKEPRLWYNALMDYGSYLKKTYGNHSARSKHYAKQSKFKGSPRELRGAILRALTRGPQTERILAKSIDRAPSEIRTQLLMLRKEGMLVERKGKYLLP